MAEALIEGARLSWSGGIDAALIEAALSRLRYSAAGEAEGGEGLAIRTNLLTLVIYAGTKEEAMEAARSVISLPGRHPSRTLVVTAAPGTGEPRIDAELAAHCHTAPGLERQVCCEEVDLTIAGPPARHLHSIVAALLVPDLPVHLWWHAPVPQDQHLFRELVDYADRLILDSARLGPPVESLRGVADLAAAAPPRCSTSDLNWGRTLPWREAVGRHSASLSLPSPFSARVTFVGSPGDPVPAHALLLLGWLVTKGPPGQRPVISAAPQDAASLRPGSLISLVIGPAHGPGGPLLSAQRIEAPPRLRVLAHHGGRQVEECLPFEDPDDSELLARELDALGPDPEHQAALAAAIGIGGSLTSTGSRR